MIPKFEKQANITGIAAGAVCTSQLPADRVHHGLHLMCRKAASAPMSRAEIIADVGTIVIRLGGEIKFEASAQVLLDLFKYWYDKDGAYTVDGMIPIPYIRPNLLTAQERSLMAWGMEDVASYTIEVNITAVAALVSMEPWCEVEDAKRKLGRHLCISHHPQTFATTGVQELTSLPFGDNDVGILAMHIGENTADIDNVTVKATRAGVSEVLCDEVPMEMNRHLLRMAGRTAQTDYYHVDFARINHRTGFLPSGDISAMRTLIDWEAAGGAPSNFPIYLEEIRGLSKGVA